MNHKKRKRMPYAIVVFTICICMLELSDKLDGFFLGVLAGFHGVDYEYAKQNYGEISRIAGGITVAILIAVFLYMLLELRKEKRERELQEERNLQLYAGIAHDLKTPMTMIMGYARLLEDEAEVVSGDRRQYTKYIIEQTQHANRLLDSLLSYTRLQNSSYELRMEKGDIAECLRAVVASCYPALEEAGMEPELFIPEKVVEARFDEHEMKRVFTNMLMNMVKHNPLGTKSLIQMEEVGDVIRIVFADNGPQVPGGMREKLFDAFVTGDSSRNSQNGSGLGLSISKKVVERHNGIIRYVDSWKEGYKAFLIELIIK